MTASDHVQPQQLAMFMTPHEILSTHTSAEARSAVRGEAVTADDHTRLWDRKLAESKMNKHQAYGPVSRYDSIKQEGVHTPVDLVHRTQTIIEGHHRIAAQNDQDPNKLMPVLHHASMKNYDSFAVGQAYRGHV